MKRIFFGRWESDFKDDIIMTPDFLFCFESFFFSDVEVYFVKFTTATLNIKFYIFLWFFEKIELLFCG